MYSPVVRTAVVALDPAGNGRSLSVLGDPRNSAVNLTGAVPGGARVIGRGAGGSCLPRIPSPSTLETMTLPRL
jgi:hypothetical protein